MSADQVGRYKGLAVGSKQSAKMGIEDRPPTPKYVTYGVRVLEISILVVMMAWVFGPLNGVRVTPKKVTGFLLLLMCQCAWTTCVYTAS